MEGCDEKQMDGKTERGRRLPALYEHSRDISSQRLTGEGGNYTQGVTRSQLLTTKMACFLRRKTPFKINTPLKRIFIT